MDIFVVKVTEDTKHGWRVIKRDPTAKSRARLVVIEKFSRRTASQEYVDKLNAGET